MAHIKKSNGNINLLWGAKPNDRACHVSGVGDVNGDKIDDLVVGAINASPFNRSWAGETYVVYGKKGGINDIDFADLSQKQWTKLSGDANNTMTGSGVTGVGDVNGDKINDIILGTQSGAKAYVIYGQIGGIQDIDLVNLNLHQGFKIIGSIERGKSSYNVGKAGDIDGDSINDIIVCMPDVDPLGNRPNAGECYIIYGVKGGSSNIYLPNLTPAQGFKVIGANSSDHLGSSLSSAGDVNGDGLADVIIGAPVASPLNRFGAGLSYVIYGKKGGLSNIDLANFKIDQGFKIFGAHGNKTSWDNSGSAVDGIGDFNGDGIDDVAVGSAGASPFERLHAGEDYVIYGKKGGFADNIDLASLKSEQGFRIFGAISEDKVGVRIKGIGDINGDALLDILVVAFYASPLHRLYAGESYVIYGKKTGYEDIDLANFSKDQGFRIFGAKPQDHAGMTNWAGDINADGIKDVIIGSVASPFNRNSAGESYLIYGQTGKSDDIDLFDYSLEYYEQILVNEVLAAEV